MHTICTCIQKRGHTIFTSSGVGPCTKLNTWNVIVGPEKVNSIFSSFFAGYKTSVIEENTVQMTQNIVHSMEENLEKELLRTLS